MTPVRAVRIAQDAGETDRLEEGRCAGVVGAQVQGPKPAPRIPRKRSHERRPHAGSTVPDGDVETTHAAYRWIVRERVKVQTATADDASRVNGNVSPFNGTIEV